MLDGRASRVSTWPGFPSLYRRCLVCQSRLKVEHHKRAPSQELHVATAVQQKASLIDCSALLPWLACRTGALPCCINWPTVCFKPCFRYLGFRVSAYCSETSLSASSHAHHLLLLCRDPCAPSRNPFSSWYAVCTFLKADCLNTRPLHTLERHPLAGLQKTT